MFNLISIKTTNGEWQQSSTVDRFCVEWDAYFRNISDLRQINNVVVVLALLEDNLERIGSFGIMCMQLPMNGYNG